MDPETYLDEIRADVPRYDELQEATVDAIPFPPRSPETIFIQKIIFNYYYNSENLSSIQMPELKLICMLLPITSKIKIFQQIIYL